MKLNHKWLIVLLIIVGLVLLLIAKKALAPKEVEAQALIPVSSPSVVFNLPSVFPTASSTFERIGDCESGMVATAQNPESTASGCYQFLDSSWDYYGKKLWGTHLNQHSKLNCTDSTILAAYVYGKNGTTDWTASQSCWDR